MCVCVCVCVCVCALSIVGIWHVYHREYRDLKLFVKRPVVCACVYVRLYVPLCMHSNLAVKGSHGQL